MQQRIYRMALIPQPEAKLLFTQYGTDVPYTVCTERQEQQVAAILDGSGSEAIFFCEHAPVYTAGSSADEADYKGNNDIPVVPTGRGGKHTYHGPGQRVVYPILDLRTRNRDLRAYICALQDWLVKSLAEFGIEAFCRDEVGVWVTTPKGEAKIAAIGVRVRKWVTFHGIALNVHPNMQHFGGIVPCGIADKGVTSLHELGVTASMDEVDKVLKEKFTSIFGGKFI